MKIQMAFVVYNYLVKIIMNKKYLVLINNVLLVLNELLNNDFFS